MRAFHALVFDGFVKGTQDVFTDHEYDAQLGAADHLCISGYSANGAGATSIQLTIQIEQSPDQRHWTSRNTTAEVNALTLATTGEPIFTGQDGDPATRASLGYARLRIRLGATTHQAQLRIWVTGRDHG